MDRDRDQVFTGHTLSGSGLQSGYRSTSEVDQILVDRDRDQVFTRQSREGNFFQDWGCNPGLVRVNRVSDTQGSFKQ